MEILSEVDDLLARADEARDLLESVGGEYQVFARLISGKTITIDGLQATDTLDTLQKKIKAKDGTFSTEDCYLVYGGKKITDAKNMGAWGITREATVWVHGRLRGGYGETAAVEHTLDAGIQRGNNSQTVADTGGKSRAHKDWGRHLAGQDAFYDAVFKTLRMQGVDLTQEWWEKNRIHVQSLVQETTQAGNCGDFAQIVHSQLVANTGPDQHVYEVVMAGKWDHQLCLTYPSSVSSIAAMDQDLATIADGWDNYMVIPLKKFLNKSNCYGAKITNLDKCPDCGKSSGDGCKTEDEPEKKCPGFLTIVAQQQCEGDGGLAPNVKDAIGGIISEAFESWKASDDYTEYLDKVKDDRRGIFRFSVRDEIYDRRSDEDILTKLNTLAESGAPTLKAELLDLDDDNLVAVFGDGTKWRDLTLSIPEVLARLYAAWLKQDTAGFLQCVNHLTDEQFMAFLGADGANLAKVISADYAATRLFNLLNRAGDADTLRHCKSMSDAAFIQYFDSSKDARNKILGSAAIRNAFFAAVLKVGGGELARVVGTLGDKQIDLFGSGTAARAAILGDESLKAAFFTILAKQKGSALTGPASLMSVDDLLGFFRSSKDARKALTKSSMKEATFDAIAAQDEVTVTALLGMLPRKLKKEYEAR